MSCYLRSGEFTSFGKVALSPLNRFRNYRTGLWYPDREGQEFQHGVAPNELTASEHRDWFAGTPFHKHAYTMADFCDLVALGKGCVIQSLDEIQHQLQQQAGQMNEMLIRLRQEPRFRSLVEQDPQEDPETASWLYAAILLTICELRRELNDLADKIPKTEVTKKPRPERTAGASASTKRWYSTSVPLLTFS